MAQCCPCPKKSESIHLFCFVDSAVGSLHFPTRLGALRACICVRRRRTSVQVLNISEHNSCSHPYSRQFSAYAYNIPFHCALLFLELENKPNLKSFLIVCHCQRCWPQARKLNIRVCGNGSWFAVSCCTYRKG